MMLRRCILSLIAVFITVGLWFSAPPAYAENFIVVNTLDDEPLVAGDGLCTLREAINNANADADTTGGDCASGSSDQDTITFADGIVGTIFLQSQLEITDADGLTIDGGGNVTISGDSNNDGNGDVRVLYVDSGVLEVRNLTIANGRASSGGGIYNNGGTVTVTDSTLSGNTVTYTSGGGIYNNGGTVTVSNSMLNGNTATSSGGGIYNTAGGTVTVTDSTLSGNTASANADDAIAAGGGIYNNGGMVTVTDSTLSGNTASAAMAPSYGGGIVNAAGGTVTVTDSTLSGAMASYGGGIYNDNGGTVTVTDSTLSGNTGSSGGGGIYNNGGTVTVSNSTLSGNTGSSGGGIYNTAGGTVTVTDSTLSSNTATGNTASSGGGGIANTGNNSTVTVSNSTLSGNTASGDTHNSSSVNAGGGAIRNVGIRNTVTVINSTLSGNTATTDGGGIYNAATGTMTLINSTLSGNSARSGGGIHNYNGNGSIANTIIANSTGGDCVKNGGTITPSGLNLIEDGSKCGDPGSDGYISGDPMLGSLANNGGPTATHALLDGSPAIDAGDEDICADPDTVDNKDQRGVARPQGGKCDIGAYELEQTPTAVELVSFTAVVDGERVTLRWETGAEIDNAGFHLHRAPSPDGPYTRITDSLIAALGTLHAGAVYTYTDTPGQGLFYYRLEDIDTDGVSTFHGPAQVSSGEQTFSAANRLYVPMMAAD